VIVKKRKFKKSKDYTIENRLISKAVLYVYASIRSLSDGERLLFSLGIRINALLKLLDNNIIYF